MNVKIVKKCDVLAYVESDPQVMVQEDGDFEIAHFRVSVTPKDCKKLKITIEEQ